ncbi:unnamed protein product [Pieris macdunnoughi]|uniref:Lipase domain-containing protein n=1 Tax=Pieris macdunnoughi TaxID=345717 RepID=A0A821RS23_9NEOP|nr:unnamed protein product [Pieris macdunnoughi]
MSIRREKMFLISAILVFVWLYGSCDDNGPGYGDEWLYYFDENDTRFIMNFSLIPQTTGGMRFGDAYFNLYTRNNNETAERLIIEKNNNRSIINSNFFDKTKDVKVLTHGWLSSDEVNWLQEMKFTFLKEYDLNVITVNWGELAKNKFYPWAALSTRYVGKRVAKLLNVITESYEIGYESVHLIGHSLGAQVMGYAGMFSNGSIPRITGLDPARPLFELPKMPNDYALDKSDASFVDIIHTAAGTYGYRGNYGHADFYPNRGTQIQPGCEKETACSHGRACVYFGESIIYTPNSGFLSYPCDNWDDFQIDKCKDNAVSMGLPASSTARGKYYLNTSNHSKYADV